MPSSALFKTWKHEALETKLICTTEVQARAGVPAEQCGVSLAWLEKFSDIVRAAAEAATSGQQLSSCTDVIKTLVNPTCAEAARSRFWNFIPSDHAGAPNWYVAAPRSMPFCDMVAQLLECLSPTAAPAATATQQPSQGTAPAVSHSAEWKKQVFLWISIFSVPQQQGAMYKSSDLLLLKNVVCACPDGLIAVLDSEKELLNCSLSMYETWVALHYGGPQRLKVAFPASIEAGAAAAFLGMCTTLDLKRTVGRSPEERAHILSEVKHIVGMKRVNTELSEGLLRAAHVALRWSGKPKDLAVYCCTLLERGEYAQLHMVLCTIPELMDDDQGLQDIRDLFKLYDADGSGELDVDEFFDFLNVAGFEKDEVQRIFQEVKGGEEGEVTLEEFERWWLITQREQKSNKRDVQLTCNALRKNLAGMIAYLDRIGLGHYADVFRLYEAKAETGMILPANEPLQPPALRGEWAKVAEQAGFLANVRDVKAANKMLYEALMLNHDLIDAPSNEVPHPDGAIEDCPQKLVVYMDLYLQLIQRQGTAYKRLASFFEATLLDFKQHGMNQAMKASSVNPEANFEIIKSTVALRYGANEPLTRERVQEAQMAVSQYMASNRAAAAAPDSASELLANSAAAGIIDAMTNAAAKCSMNNAAIAEANGTRTAGGVGAHYVSRNKAPRAKTGRPGRKATARRVSGGNPKDATAGGNGEGVGEGGAKDEEWVPPRNKSARALARSNSSMLRVLTGAMPFVPRLNLNKVAPLTQNASDTLDEIGEGDERQGEAEGEDGGGDDSAAVLGDQQELQLASANAEGSLQAQQQQQQQQQAAQVAAGARASGGGTETRRMSIDARIGPAPPAFVKMGSWGSGAGAEKVGSQSSIEDQPGAARAQGAVEADQVSGGLPSVDAIEQANRSGGGSGGGLAAPGGVGGGHLLSLALAINSRMKSGRNNKQAAVPQQQPSAMARLFNGPSGAPQGPRSTDSLASNNSDTCIHLPSARASPSDATQLASGRALLQPLAPLPERKGSSGSSSNSSAVSPQGPLSHTRSEPLPLLSFSPGARASARGGRAGTNKGMLSRGLSFKKSLSSDLDNEPPPSLLAMGPAQKGPSVPYRKWTKVASDDEAGGGDAASYGSCSSDTVFLTPRPSPGVPQPSARSAPLLQPLSLLVARTSGGGHAGGGLLRGLPFKKAISSDLEHMHLKPLSGSHHFQAGGHRGGNPGFLSARGPGPAQALPQPVPSSSLISMLSPRNLLAPLKGKLTSEVLAPNSSARGNKNKVAALTGGANGGYGVGGGGGDLVASPRSARHGNMAVLPPIPERDSSRPAVAPTGMPPLHAAAPSKGRLLSALLRR